MAHVMKVHTAKLIKHNSQWYENALTGKMIKHNILCNEHA